MTRVLLATRNPGKLREYEALLEGMAVDWRLLADVGLDMDVEETGATFEANARLKALAYLSASGLPTLADDSGLEVDVLDGAPGVFSARYAGPGATDADRYGLLLRNLAEVPDGERAARFVCVAAFALPGGELVTGRGTVEGRIMRKPRGENGFGYDPVFWVEEMGCTMAELAAADKNRVSHRARALAALRPQIERLLGLG